ncbi:MAG: hypothetical protein HQ483_11635 [Rhodospirillales bacterium]|nr:hypothetical protein [Rhodospirillales bacterium]
MDSNDHDQKKAAPPGPGQWLLQPVRRPWQRFRKLPKRLMVLFVGAYIVISSGLTGLLWYSLGDGELGLASFRGIYSAAADAAGVRDNGLPENVAGRQLFYWKNDNGDSLRSAVDTGPYRKFATTQMALINGQRNASLLATNGRIRTELRPMLTDIELRVTAYGDWMYNWWTAWILLAQASGWAWESLLDGL